MRRLKITDMETVVIEEQLVEDSIIIYKAEVITFDHKCSQ